MLNWFGRKLRESQERDGQAGFTLIELLVVVIIIGILAAIAIPTFLAQRDKARQAAQESDMRNLAANATACSADFDGNYTGCTRAVLGAAPYNFKGTADVTCVTPATVTGASALGPNAWSGECRHTLLPAGQKAVFDTGGTNAGRVSRIGY